jgi:SAM-dependent methyltransferase
MPQAIGIDLSRPRLEAGEVFFRERFGQHSTGIVRLRRGNLFAVDYERPVDVFYLKASIHHILPVPDLFRYLQRNLAPGGIVVIHDVNALHPISQYRALRTRGFSTRRLHHDPETGETWPYAVEAIFTLPGMLWRLRKYGFRVVYKQAYLGLRARAGDRLWRRCIEPLNRSMLLGAFLAPAYRIVGQKPLGHSAIEAEPSTDSASTTLPARCRLGTRTDVSA